MKVRNSISSFLIWCGLIACACLWFLSCPIHAANRLGPRLLEVKGGKLWMNSEDGPRIYFPGSIASGFDTVFQAKVDGRWQSIAAFPSGKVWVVYNEWGKNIWDPQWFSGQHSFKISTLRTISDLGVLEATGQGFIDGAEWEFSDRYSFEAGAIKVVRSWHHLSTLSQAAITLATLVRVNLGGDTRWMLPGIIYNDNPGTYPTRQVPHLPYVPFAKGVYEENRFPVPFVNMESTVASHRIYASIISVPSRVPEAHRSEDQWWSLGLQWLWGNKADLMLLSGAVTTNGMNSMVYGHLNGFDPYEGAYIDAKGNVTFQKTFYIDVGAAKRKGYSFRETLWKTFKIFDPYRTQSIPFDQAMDLKFQYAANTFYHGTNGADGFPLMSLAEDPRTVCTELRE